MWDNDPSAYQNERNYDILLRDLLKCHIEAERGKRSTVNTMNFEIASLENIARLADNIHHRRYQPGRGIAFITHQPVIREIFAAPFPDRIVHHYLYSKTSPYWESQFIPHTYSCIKGRGTLHAVLAVYDMMQKVSNNWTEKAHFIKLDIQGYFMSLNREKLLKEALKGLDDQFKPGERGYEYETLRFLWRQVILDDPVKGAHFRNFPHDWKDLPPSKSLLNQAPGVGIVIGNLTSQELSNIYLNKLDWFVTKTLGWENYVRYVDDFVIIVNDRDYKRALKDVPRIESFLTSLGLTLHPKKRHIQPINHGLEFLGARLYPGTILPGKRLAKNARRAARLYAKGVQNGDSVVSYLGHIKHLDGERLQEEILDIIYHHS